MGGYRFSDLVRVLCYGCFCLLLRAPQSRALPSLFSLSLFSVKGVQCIEAELAQEKRKARKLVQGSPAFADAFLRMLGDTGERRIWVMLCPDQHNRRKREAVKALADRDAAVAEMKTPRIKQQDLENIGTRSRGHSQPQSWALAIVRTRSRWHRSRWHRSRGHPHYARGRGR